MCHMEVIVSAHLMNLTTQTLTQVQIIPTKAVSPITAEEYFTSDSTDESESQRVLSKSDSHPP